MHNSFLLSVAALPASLFIFLFFPPGKKHAEGTSVSPLFAKVEPLVQISARQPPPLSTSVRYDTAIDEDPGNGQRLTRYFARIRVIFAAEFAEYRETLRLPKVTSENLFSFFAVYEYFCNLGRCLEREFYFRDSSTGRYGDAKMENGMKEVHKYS